jgi:hypothetical protein
LVKPKFEPYTPIGRELSTASTYVQAALALDLAASLAVESRDAEQLTQIAMVWLEMGSRLSGGDDEEEDEFEEGDVAGDSESYPLGFASPAVDAEVKRKKEEKNGNEGNS